MKHPHIGPGPAGPSAPGGHGTAPVRPAGEAGPGVPLSIWPDLPAPHGGDGPGQCAGPVTVRAAARIVAAFSRPGDLVAAPDGSAAVIEAAAGAGRRVLALIPARGPGAPAGPRARPDPAVRLRPGGPDLLLAPGDPDAGQAALAITGCCGGPEPGGEDADGLRAGLLYAACERVLRPGGLLAVITANPGPGGEPGDLAGHAVAAARAAGLVYAQHIVLVHAAIRDDQLAPDPAVTASAGLPGGFRVHSDLLVFTKLPGGTTRND